MLAPWKKSYDKPRQHIKNIDITLLTKVSLVKTMVFPVIRYGWIWELDDKEGWEPKNWCFQTVVLEKTHECSLNKKEIKPVNPKGNQSRIFIGRNNAEPEAPILWPPGGRSQLIRKDHNAGKDRRQEEQGTTGDETFGWHHWFNVLESEQTLGDRVRKAWCAAVHGVTKSSTWLSDWTATTKLYVYVYAHMKRNFTKKIFRLM